MKLERWNDDKMGALDAKVSDMDVRLARVEVRVDDGFKKVDERFEQVDKRFEKVDTELLEQRRQMNAAFERVNDRLTHLLVAAIGGAATIAAALFAAPHL